MQTLSEVPDDRGAARLAVGQTKSSGRILVVEDDRDILELSRAALVRCGYQVDGAGDGAAGWEALRAQHYDLLITDHNMPKVTGVELVRKLRGARMALPVILVSGNMPMAELSQHPPLQLEAKMLKPYTTAQLLGTVAELLRADGRVLRTHPPSACAGSFVGHGEPGEVPRPTGRAGASGALSEEWESSQGTAAAPWG